MRQTQTKESEIKKQTTANNEFLRQVKTLMNKKIYKTSATLVNTEGEDSAREWLQRFFNRPVSEVFPK